MTDVMLYGPQAPNGATGETCDECGGQVLLEENEYRCADCEVVVQKKQDRIDSRERYQYSGRVRLVGGITEAYIGDGEYEFVSHELRELH